MKDQLFDWCEQQKLEDEGAMITARDQGDWNRYHRLEGHKMAILKVQHKIRELDALKASAEMDRCLIARDAILEDLKAKFKAGDTSVKANDPDHHWHKPQKNYFSGAGRLDCPICKQAKALTYSRSSYNGHVHASCATTDCVWFKE